MIIVRIGGKIRKSPYPSTNVSLVLPSEMMRREYSKKAIQVKRLRLKIIGIPQSDGSCLDYKFTWFIIAS